jgi:hypothetical protein
VSVVAVAPGRVVARPAAGRGVPIALVGRCAERALTADDGWRVAAVFRRTFYCRSAQGSLVLIAPATVGAGPLHALVQEPGGLAVPRLEVGRPVAIDGAGAEAAAGALRLDLGAARRWRAPVPPRWDARALRQGLAVLGVAAAAEAPAAGVGRLIVPLAVPDAASAAPPARSAVERVAWSGLVALSRWTRRAGRGGAPPPPAEAGALLGLGPGLTPSGDDALAGALLALHALGRADVARRLARWLLPRAARGTGAISRAHLECAAHGEGSAALHDALGALVTGDPDALARVLAAVGRLGHTSGWDALAGVAAIGAAHATAAAAEGRSACR